MLCGKAGKTFVTARWSHTPTSHTKPTTYVQVDGNRDLSSSSSDTAAPGWTILLREGIEQLVRVHHTPSGVGIPKRIARAVFAAVYVRWTVFTPESEKSVSVFELLLLGSFQGLSVTQLF